MFTGRHLELVLVYRSDPGAPQRPARLCGFFPFERTTPYRGLPIATLVSFQHLHCYARGHRNLVVDEDNQHKAHVFELTPGDGLYFPVTWPHWVKNGPHVSVSFSITFRTRWSDRREILYHVHERLGRLGIRLPPIGRSALADGAQYHAFRTLARARRLLGGRIGA